MKKIFKSILVYLLLAIGIISIFASPEEASASWYRDYILLKLVAVLSFMLLARCLRWDTTSNNKHRQNNYYEHFN